MQTCEAKSLVMTLADSPEPAALHARHSTGGTPTGCRGSSYARGSLQCGVMTRRWACKAEVHRVTYGLLRFNPLLQQRR